MIRSMPGILLTCLLLVVTGCAQAPYDYTALNEAQPLSILVLPPVSDAIDVQSSYTFLSTITQPLAERGYYVFPVAVIDRLFKENGLPHPEDMNAVPLDKLYEQTGADAVLYVHINDWGQKYQIITSTTIVDSDVRLVDARTGVVLWESHLVQSQGSGDGGGGIAGMIAGAIVQQIMASKLDLTVALSGVAAQQAIENTANGLLPGPYHPQSSFTKPGVKLESW